MKTETLFETLTTATEALRTVQPLLKMKPAEFERYAPIMAALRLEVRRVLGGEFSQEQYRMLKPWQPEKVKADLRSDALKAIDAEIEQLDGEYKEAAGIWERYTLEKINRHSALVTTTTFQIVPRTDAREEAELDRCIETAAAERDARADKLQAARGRRGDMAKAEQAERQAAAQRKQQAAAMEAKQQAAEVRKQSFAKDALQFFGIRA